MIQPPTAIGIVLCEQVIEAKRTGALTYVNCFRIVRSRAFPTRPTRFTVQTLLTDGLGAWGMTLVIAHPDTLDFLAESPSELQ
jgi:hypothetical protein